MHLIKKTKSIKWMKRCNALFILKDFQNDTKQGYIHELVKIYKCEDTTKMKEEEVREFVKSETNRTHFLFDSKLQNLRSILNMKQETQFMPIPLVAIYYKSFDDSFGLCEKSDWPVYVGWFWNNRFQRHLYDLAKFCLKEILEVDDFKLNLVKKLKNDQLDNYWTEQKKRLHVTAMYIGNKKTRQNEQYLDKVFKQFYTTTESHLTGFLLTPKTFSAHVNLSENVKWMFDPAQQDEFHLLTHVTVATAPNVRPVQSGLDMLKIQKMIKSKKVPKQQVDIKVGTVYDWGDCCFYVVLKEPLNNDLMFLPKYY